MIRNGDFIKHVKFMDLCCEIVEVLDEGYVCIRWFNMGFIKSWPLDNWLEFIIPDHNWLKADDPNRVCLRYTTWSKI